MDSASKEHLLQTQRSATSSLAPVSIPNPTFDDENDESNGRENNQRDQVISNQDDVPGLDDEIVLTPNDEDQQQQLPDANEVGGQLKVVTETSNNPDSTIDGVEENSKFQRRMMLEKGERYTDNASLDVSSKKDPKKLKGVNQPIPLKTMMHLNETSGTGGVTNGKMQQQFLSPKGQAAEYGSGRSSINLSAWHSNGPKNFLEVVKQQLDTQRPQITFYSKNPQNKMKGQKVINPHFSNHHQQQHSRAHMNTQLNNNLQSPVPVISINGITKIQQSGSMFSENDLSFSKDLILDPNHNLMMVMVKQINAENEPALNGNLTAPAGESGPNNPFNASQFQENFIQKMELQSQQQINLMSEIKEHNESLEGSPRRIKGTAWINCKKQSVAKVTMAFQGMEVKDKSAFLGQNNPFAKLESLARDRQKRLSDRIGNPIVEYLKRREELQQAQEHYSMKFLETGENASPNHATGRIVHQNFNNHNKLLKRKQYSKTHAHSPSSGALGSPTEHGSEFKNPNSPSVSSIDQTMMQKPVMISHPVYYQPTPVALPLLDPLARANNGTATSYYSGGDDNPRRYQKTIENKKSRAPVWLRGLSQKQNGQPQMIVKPQMLFPLEPPIDEKSKNFNQTTVHMDAAYLDASIIQSKGIKVRASMANFRAQKYLTYLQQKVNKEKAKSIQRGDELHTVLEIPLNLSPLPMYADYSQQHHPNCSVLKDHQHQISPHQHNYDASPFNETFYSNEGGPIMLPVNGVQCHSPVKQNKSAKQKSQGTQHTQENSATRAPTSNPPTAEPCLSKLPSLRTREISPRFNITVKDQHLQSKDQNSTVQGSPQAPQEMTFFNTKDNTSTGDDIFVVLNPPGTENITYGIGGSLHMSLEKQIEYQPPTQVTSVQQTSSDVTPEATINSSQLKDFVMPQHKYMKKSKLMEQKLHQEQQLNQRTNSQVMHKTTYHHHPSIKPKNFVGSGGFQRILGDDFTFNYENDLVLGGKISMTPGAIKGLAADDISSPNQSFISYANRVRKTAQNQHQNNHQNPNGKIMILSSVAFNNSELSHNEAIDLKGHKLTFAHKEVKKLQTQV